MPAHQEHDAFEELLPDTLNIAAAGFPPPSHDLLDRSVAQGVRIRRGRAVRMGAGALALAATATAAGLLVVHTGGSHSGPTQAAAAPTGKARDKSPAPKQTLPGVTAQQMVQTLTGLLPSGGSVSKAIGQGTDAGSPSASLTYTGASGVSGIDVSISRLDPGTPRDQEGEGNCLPVEVRPYDRCTVTALPHGAQLTTVKSFTYPNSDTGQRRWYAVYTTADGAQVVLEEFGGGGEKASGGSAAPVLSMAQLAAIAQSPAWTAVIAAIPPRTPASAGPGSLAPTASSPSGPAMTQLIRSMLPAGGRLSDVNASTGLVQLEYDDGHGRTMVEVDVQQGMGDALQGHLNCEDPARYCKALKLADGTEVQITENGSEKGGSAVVWLVDTLRPDGRRVVVREVNSYAESAPPTRLLPALTLAELQAIAVDGRWWTSNSAG